MKSLVTEIIINASKEQVWKTLSNFADYPNWNPFITSIDGSPIENTSLINQINIEGKVQTFKPTVVKIIENQKLEWVGKLPLGMFTGHHCFEIIELAPNQVKLIHQEHFTGWIAGILLKMIADDTQNGFIAMNKALKQTVEQL